MVPAQSQTLKFFTRDLAAYNDAELDQYLEINRGEIEVEDPEILKKDEDLVQRLRARAGAGVTNRFRPIDLNDITARLHDISDDSQARFRSPSPTSSTTTPYNEEEYYRYHLEEETECYNTLVSEGGRPSHPVSLGRDVIDNPGEYHEILSYWQSSEYDWMVFDRQMGNWRVFRDSQRYNREEGRFPKYVKAVKRGLASHGFTKPFQLDEDLERQDKLTTWIEYLDYEYWKQGKDMKTAKRHQPQYDEAWKVLVDSQVLRPFETEEIICNIDSAFQRAGEEDRAEKAVESAKSAVMLASKDISGMRRSNLSQGEPRQTFAAAQSKLDTAIKSLESIKRLNHLVGEFKVKNRDYLVAKHAAEGRIPLLRWILQQADLIELELNPVKVTEIDSTGCNGEKPMLKRNCAIEVSEGRVLKRPRQDETLHHRTRVSTTPDCERQLRCKDSIHEGPVAKRPRYNGQNHGLSLRETPGAADSTSTGEPLCVHPTTAHDPEPSAAGKAKARSIRQSGSNRTKSVVKPKAGVVQDDNARVTKRGIQSEKSRILSTLVSRPLRRSTRMKKRPERFQ